MEGTDGQQESTEAGKATAEVAERDAVALVRFATASLGAREAAVGVVRDAFVEADAASLAGDLESLDRPRLFAAVRKKAAQLVEQRRRSPDAPRLEANAFVEHVRPTEREALLLRYVARLAVGDVALATGTDVDTAQRRLSRGLVFLCRLRSGVAVHDAPSDEVAAGRRRVEEALAEIVDGLASDELADFVAGDDDARDLVHDAEGIVAKLRDLESANDGNGPALVATLLDACAAARPKAVPLPAAVEAVTEGVVQRPASAADASPTETDAEGSPQNTSEPTPVRPEPMAAAKPAAQVKPAAAKRHRLERAGIVAGLVAAVGALALFVHHSPSHYADEAWSGTVDDVSGAFDERAGLERCSPDRAVCSHVDKGDDVPAGSTLRTDGQTRAAVLLHDGTRLVLDRDSEVLLDGAYPRRARLDHGSVVADVTLLGQSRARFDLPMGFAEVESAKVSLVTEESRADVAVARGSVRLVDASERGVAVHAQEEGRLEAGSPPMVYATSSLGARFRWTETARTLATEPGAEEIRGLGELAAKRPGEEHEKKGLVTLASHTTRVRIVGNVARTEIEEEFRSSSDDVLEGVYRFPLPPDAQIERLALDVDGKVEEGAFVDRDRASAIWRGAIVNAGAKKPVGEEIVWVPGPWRDPALLEWQRGGRFELRIYPIPKRASRKVLLAYTQVIAPSGGLRRYIYPLPHDPSGSSRVGRFDLDVQVRGNDAHAGVTALGYEMRQDGLSDGARQLTFVKEGFLPSGDLTIEYALPDSTQEVTAWAYQPSPDEQDKPIERMPGQDGAYVALALRPKLPRSEDRVQRDFAIVVDSSRSMYGERFRRATAVTARIVRELDPGDRVTVLACDSTCREMPGTPLRAGLESSRAVESFLGGVTPEGGSDVAAAVKSASDALRGAPRGAARVVYVGDGTPTIGAVAPAFLRREVESSVPRDFGTVTAVAVGSDADVATLTTLANAGGGVVVPYTPGEAAIDAAFALLGAAYGTTLTDVALELPDGLYDVAPQQLGTLRAGGEQIVVARMSGSAVSGTLTLRGKIGGAPFEQHYPIRIDATTSKGNAFVPRLWAAGKLLELEQLPDHASREQAVALSARFHVASRYTSLLVLESDAMMHAFGLDRDERTPLWMGDSTAESSSSEGETAIQDADDGTGAAVANAEPAPAPADKAELGLQGLDSAGGYAAHASRGAPATAKAPQAMRPSQAPAAAPAPATETAPAKPKSSYYASADEAPAYEAEKKQRQASPSANGTAGAAPGGGGLGTRLGEPLARRSREEMEGPALMPSPFAPPPPNFGRRYVPMRKIWERVGHIVPPVTARSAAAQAALDTAERAAEGSDPSREAMKRLYTLYFLDDRLDAAGSVAERWSAKDPLDPDALTARADVAAARGDRDTAIRILGSVVDVRPGDHKAVFRLARLHRWAGRPELACRHSMAAAEIRSNDAKLVAEAIRCARDLGHADVATDLFALVDDATRRATDALLSEKVADPSLLSGDLRLEATWDGGDDLDLSLLPPDGGRISWLGAPTRAVITARDVQSTSREGLALRGSTPGDYVVELTRPAGHRGSVHGSVAVYAAGDRRVVPIAFDGPSTRVALLKITTRSRLVPL